MSDTKTFRPAGQRHNERVLKRLKADAGVHALIRSVAAERHIPLYQLLSAGRGSASAAAARQLAMYLVHVELGRAQDIVAEYFGRQRTTVHHACQKMEELRESAAMEEEIGRITRRCSERLEAPGAHHAG